MLLYDSIKWNSKTDAKERSVILGRPLASTTFCSRTAIAGQRDASIRRLVKLKKIKTMV